MRLVTIILLGWLYLFASNTMAAFSWWPRRSCEQTLSQNDLKWFRGVLKKGDVYLIQIEGEPKDESALFHERAHSQFHATYNETAFVNRQKTIQEALADFANAHFRNSPRIGESSLQDDLPLREIKERYSTTRKAVSSLKKPLDLKLDDHHMNSLLTSHILWTIRSFIGRDQMDILFKPIVDNLNQFRESYVRLMVKEGREPGNSMQEDIYNLEFLLATIYRTRQLLPPDSQSSMEELLVSLAHNLEFSPDRIEYVASRLSDSGEDFSPSSKNQLNQIIAAGIYSATGFVIRLTALFWLADTFNPF
jgi:hypothetical protein